MLADERCSRTILDFLHTTEAGHRVEPTPSGPGVNCRSEDGGLGPRNREQEELGDKDEELGRGEDEDEEGGVGTEKGDLGTESFSLRHFFGTLSSLSLQSRSLFLSFPRMRDGDRPGGDKGSCRGPPAD